MLIFISEEIICTLKGTCFQSPPFVSLLQKAQSFSALPKLSYYRLLCFASLGSHVAEVLPV